MRTNNTLTKEEKGRQILEAPVSQIDDMSDWGFMQNTLMIERKVHVLQLAGISRDLHQRYEMTQNAVRKHNLSVRLIGYAPVFNHQKIYRGANTDWVIMPLPQDPTYKTGEPFYLPKHAHQDLRRVHRSGIEFESLFIAHEIPKHRLADGQQVPLELIAPPLPKKHVENAEKAAHLVAHFWDGVVKTIAFSAMATATAAATALFAPAAAVSVLAAPVVAVGLDPIIFGLHIDKSQQVNGMPLAMWYYITHWTWDED